jgi:hypothetical protein
MTMFQFLASAVLVLVPYWGGAQHLSCSDTDAKKAFDEADNLRSWDALYASYNKYRSCDDGAISEGYSESVARIIVDHWSTMPQLGHILKKRADFRQFVLTHIDATLDEKDLQNIKAKAASQCPPTLAKLCNEVMHQADSVLKEVLSSPK